MLKKLLAMLLCVLCLHGIALAEGDAPRLPDIAAYSDGRLTEQASTSNEHTRILSFTGSWQDVKYTLQGYMALLTGSYQLKRDAYFTLTYGPSDEEYDYFIYCFSFNGPEGDTVPNLHMRTSDWDVTGSDVVLCYSQGRPGHENVHFGFSTAFALADTGERLDAAALVAAEDTLPLPDPEACTSGRLTRVSHTYWKGGGNRVTFTGASTDVSRFMERYMTLLVKSYGMEQTDRVAWEDGTRHVTYAFLYTGKGADELKVLRRVDEENGLNIVKAHVLLSFTQEENGVTTLELEFYERDFSVKDTGDRL